MNRIEPPIFSTRERSRITSRRRFIRRALQLAMASVLVAPTLVTPGDTIYPAVSHRLNSILKPSTLQAHAPEN